MTKPILCPRCRRPALPRAENPAFPFCSRRCRLIDLGSWLTEEYRVAGSPAEAADENPGGEPSERPDDPPVLQ
jgi:uncharacterized protein